MATPVEVVTTLLTLGGLVYMLLALWGARDFAHYCVRVARGEAAGSIYAPPVTILKPVKGIDARMYAGFASHCRQEYAGEYEIVFGVSSIDDPAVAEIERLRREFPDRTIRLVECPERLGTSGKVSNLVQMLRSARFEHVLINDSDIRVSPNYLARVMSCFADPRVGMVTAPYLGRTDADGKALTLWARLEALGISTDFLPGVLTARKIEGGIRFGLGSTLALSRAALAAAGGLEPLVDYLADDYEIGARIASAGYRVELCRETVETTVPAYSFQRLHRPSAALGAFHPRLAPLGISLDWGSLTASRGRCSTAWPAASRSGASPCSAWFCWRAWPWRSRLALASCATARCCATSGCSRSEISSRWDFGLGALPRILSSGAASASGSTADASHLRASVLSGRVRRGIPLTKDDWADC